MTYYLAVAPDPIQINPEQMPLDASVVLDPHSLKSLDGLKEKSALILQSTLKTPEEVWAFLPQKLKTEIVAQKRRVFFADFLGMALQESKPIHAALLGGVMAALKQQKSIKFPEKNWTVKLREILVKRGNEPGFH